MPAARLNRIEDPRDPCRRHAVPRGDAVRFASGSRDEAVGQPHRKEAEQALRPAVPEDAALKRSEHAQPHDPAERDADIEARILVLLNHHRHAALALQFVCQAPDGRREIGRDILHDGDTIFLRAAGQFFVLGEVQNQGAYVLQPGTTVAQALATAGGLTDSGSAGR